MLSSAPNSISGETEFYKIDIFFLCDSIGWLNTDYDCIGRHKPMVANPIRKNGVENGHHGAHFSLSLKSRL